MITKPCLVAGKAARSRRLAQRRVGGWVWGGWWGEHSRGPSNDLKQLEGESPAVGRRDGI